ncbi:uncharacterized protein LOC143694158 [Agelaius phoeniceus]|uniref:uncharacterized protein LOC143694158 n=1 Tax=Agelaius phoeniceus TaxID=39638 RepID=UPI004054C4A9
MAPPPTTPAPRLSENNIGGGRRSPRPRRDWLLAPLTHTAARALPRSLTGSVVCAGRAAGGCASCPASPFRPVRGPEPFPRCWEHSRDPGSVPAVRGRSRGPVGIPASQGPPHSCPGAALGPPERPRRDRSASSQANGKENLQLLDQSRGFCLPVVVLNVRSRQ